MRGSQKASAQTGGLLAMASKTSVEPGGAKLITGLPDELLPSLSTSGETLTGTQGMTYEIGGGSPDLVAGLPARHLRAGPSTDRTPCPPGPQPDRLRTGPAPPPVVEDPPLLPTAGHRCHHPAALPMTTPRSISSHGAGMQSRRHDPRRRRCDAGAWRPSGSNGTGTHAKPVGRRRFIALAACRRRDRRGGASRCPSPRGRADPLAAAAGNARSTVSSWLCLTERLAGPSGGSRRTRRRTPRLGPGRAG